jgi:hypothetical protein
LKRKANLDFFQQQREELQPPVTLIGADYALAIIVISPQSDARHVRELLTRLK